MVTAFDLIIIVYITAFLLFIFSTHKYGFKNTFIEFLIAFFFSLSFETFNITINAHYSYPNSFFYIGKVSVDVLIGWYTIYLFGKFLILMVMSLFLLKDGREMSMTMIPIVIIANAYVSATLVMLLDPLATQTKWWTWFEPTPFLGVPIGELYGVFISVVIISCLVWISQLLLLKDINKVPGIFKRFTLSDYGILILYEAFSFMVLVMTVSNASSNSDNLMGVTVIFLASQVILFIVLLLLFSSEQFNSDFTNIYRTKIQYLVFICSLLGIISLILVVFIILSLLPISSQIFPPIISLHMIFSQFLFITLSVLLFVLGKIYSLSQSDII